MKRRFVIIPRISAHATDVIVTAPKVNVIPPIPAIRIADTTKRFLFLLRSTVWIILRPDTAINPYNATHTPPITHAGMVDKKVTKGATNEAMIARIAVVKIVTIEALPEIATQPTDSPYVVLGQPPKNAPAIEPIPSPRSVL